LLPWVRMTVLSLSSGMSVSLMLFCFVVLAERLIQGRHCRESSPAIHPLS
jgi:hypothetical protein